MIVSRVQARVLAVIVSIGIIAAPTSIFATNVVHDPQSFAQSYAQFVESIEKYNNMIKTAQDTLDTMNRINDVMNMANGMLDNLQTGIANPKQLVDRFNQNLENIKANAERTAKSLEQRDWLNTFIKEEYASCKKKWQNLIKDMERKKQQKEMSEIESTTDKCIENGGSKEECQQSTDTSKVEFNDNQKEIQVGLSILEERYNNGMTNINQAIHGAFDKVKNKMNYADMENQIQNIQNPYKHQVNICKMVEMERLKFELDEAKECYIRQTNAGNYAEAQKCFKKAKETSQKMEKEIENRKREIWNSANSRFNRDPETFLDIDEKTGKLLPEKPKDYFGNEITPFQHWKSELGDFIGVYKSENDIVEKMKITVTKTDSNGKQTQSEEERYVARPQVIQDLIHKQRINEALVLQNKRNMLVAMQGDNQALAKSQLETFTMLSYQMNELSAIVAELGKIQNEILNQTIEDENLSNKFANEKGNDLVNYKLNHSRKWQYNKYGGVELITDTKKDTSGILP